LTKRSKEETADVRKQTEKGLTGSMKRLLYKSTALWIFGMQPLIAESCVAPDRPFLPNDRASVLEYSDLIRTDFETYINLAQDYFRCLDAERARAFVEAQEVSEDYRRFVDLLGSVPGRDRTSKSATSD
jgi:hypothetical protein